jgi:3-isopropylmalate/(R)-2-methylmalate dehydratase small subunit
MEPFTRLSGAAAPLMRRNVDTDIISPMARIVNEPHDTLGRFAFEPWRFLPDGSENPDFILNQAPFRGAPILITGANFGCGSSREMAVWSIAQMGFRCVIGSSFGDIFHNNCFKNGVLAIRLPEATAEELAEQAGGGNARFTVDLEEQVIIDARGREIPFQVGAGEREMLLAGLDEIGMTLRHLDRLEAFQAADRQARPWVYAVEAVEYEAS